MLDVASLFSMEDRVALVTGGSRGVGRMIAEALLSAGARVYVSSRKAEHCLQTAEQLGRRCVGLPGDISTVAGSRQLAFEICEKEPTLDVLINNAGLAWGAPFEDFPEQGWDRVLDLNVKAPFFLTQALYPALKASGKTGRMAKVVNIGSVDGLRISPWESYSYQASKAALHHLTRRMAARLIRDNIGVTAIAPGAFPSDMNRAARDRAEEYLPSIPAARLGELRDIAAAAIYLASNASDYVIGEVLAVDGGVTFACPPPMVEP